jgi:hypothetical protein
VPLRATLSDGFEAFEVTVTLPLALPAVCGAKVTLNEVLCPGVRVTGVVIPEMLKPVPEAFTCEMVTLSPPVFCTVSVWLRVWSTVTLVNVRLVGFAVNVPAVTAVPLSPTPSDGFEAFEVTATLPLALPADAGAKVTLNEVLCPGVRVTGVVIPEMLKPVPEAFTCEMLTF